MFGNDVKYLFREYVNKSSHCFYKTPWIPCVIIGLQYGSVFAGFFFFFVRLTRMLCFYTCTTILNIWWVVIETSSAWSAECLVLKE